LLFGRDIFIIWLDLLDMGSRLFGISSEAAMWIVLILGSAHLALGAGAGWLAWRSGRLLQARFGNSFLLVSRS
jgi:hypothetical protein